MKIPLGELCRINMGQSPDSSTYNQEKRGLPFYQGNADFGSINPTPRVWCSAPVKIAHPNDILFSVRAPIGEMNIANDTCCIGRGLAAITVDDSKCEPRYIWYCLESRIPDLVSQGTGSTFKAINRGILANAIMKMTPRSNQKKIVKVLDTVNSLIALHETQLTKLDELVKARFVEIYSKAELSNEASIEAITDRVKVGFVGTCEKYYTDESGIPMLRTGNITDNGIDMTDLKYVTCEFNDKNKKSQIHEGDLLIARHGSNGQANVYYGPDAQCLNAVIIVPNKEYATSVFLAGLINSPMVKKQIEHTLVGSTQHVVNTKSIANIVVRVPSVAVQKEYELFAARVNDSKYEVRRGLDKLETLKKALMQEYFG